MAASEQDLFEKLSELGIATETVRHPAVYSVEESKAQRGQIAGMHTKNLFLKDKKGALWLVVAVEDRPIDLKQLRRRIGAQSLSFARPELLREVLGIEPGSVTPFAIINDRQVRVRVVLDAEMMTADPLNFHPLTNTATTAISAEGLTAFLRACGHEPMVIDFAAEG